MSGLLDSFSPGQKHIALGLTAASPMTRTSLCETGKQAGVEFAVMDYVPEASVKSAQSKCVYFSKLMFLLSCLHGKLKSILLVLTSTCS